MNKDNDIPLYLHKKDVLELASGTKNLMFNKFI